MATVLGVGDNSGSDTLTVTLTVAQPAGSFVHVIHAASLSGLNFFTNPSVAALPSDSQGGTWRDGTGGGSGAPVLGTSSDHNVGAVAPNRAGLQIGQTGVRTNGSGPDLGIGDTVKVTWTDLGEGAAHMDIIAIVVAFTEYTTPSIGQYLGAPIPGNFVGVYYANGNGNSLMPAFDGKTLNWATAGLDQPAPQSSCVMLTGNAAFGSTTGYLPVNGSTVAEHQSGNGRLALAATLAPATALTNLEPGGAWTLGAATIEVANYQFATGSIAPPTTRCKKCGGMLGGISVGSTFTRWV